MKQEQDEQEESLTFTKTQAYLILGSIVAIAVLSFSLGHLISSTSNLDEKEVAENIDDKMSADEPDDSLDELDAELNAINDLTTKSDEEGDKVVMLDEEGADATPPKEHLAEKKSVEAGVTPLPLTEKPKEEEKIIVSANAPLVVKSFTRRAKSASRHLPKNIHPRKKIVRVAHVATKSEKLKDLKVKAPLLPPAIPKDDLSSNASSAKKKIKKKYSTKRSSIPENSRFTVQVKTFPTPDDANELRNSLKKKGYASYIQKVIRGRSNFYRVRVGGFRSRADADDAARDMRDTEGLIGARADKYTKP